MLQNVADIKLRVLLRNKQSLLLRDQTLMLTMKGEGSLNEVFANILIQGVS